MPDSAVTAGGAGVGGWYPPTAFYFNVWFANSGGIEAVSFQEVSGIPSERKIEQVFEGGENRFVHQLPMTIEHGRLELKRAIAPLGSPLVEWCRRVLENDMSRPIDVRAVFVALIDRDGNPIRTWVFNRAYPVKWDIEGFRAQKNEVAIEKISICFADSKRLN